ncbi:hypothetical protein LEP1GSC016_3514 [Leptospira borgpetersenii serovar Hardjo-bovis str. Sponselee]|uniref:Uncharacterized protein n=1 Tax=Leptospira borgpetersenii serovar Hardjo-bovis str. Sponselee TaxID=1303729 RepID=M6BMW4_LEPBO|nr:hypothetical protein LEP1GSC016_3514 [Leptospira borgpetersenii serovar Hardjo-bovis str. Sponselee]
MFEGRLEPLRRVPQSIVSKAYVRCNYRRFSNRPRFYLDSLFKEDFLNQVICLNSHVLLR